VVVGGGGGGWCKPVLVLSFGFSQAEQNRSNTFPMKIIIIAIKHDLTATQQQWKSFQYEIVVGMRIKLLFSKG
jgi:hypothetical protein